jgi:hypothetical protein
MNFFFFLCSNLVVTRNRGALIPVSLGIFVWLSVNPCFGLNLRELCGGFLKKTGQNEAPPPPQEAAAPPASSPPAAPIAITEEEYPTLELYRSLLESGHFLIGPSEKVVNGGEPREFLSVVFPDAKRSFQVVLVPMGWTHDYQWDFRVFGGPNHSVEFEFPPEILGDWMQTHQALRRSLIDPDNITPERDELLKRFFLIPDPSKKFGMPGTRSRLRVMPRGMSL